jgi:hypothetical protein
VTSGPNHGGAGKPLASSGLSNVTVTTSTPGTVDVVTVTFDNPDEANGFPAPPWFGPEVTADPA